MKKKLISYITVVRNGENGIAETISSILPFRNDQVEYVVVDGNSTDKTMEIVKSFGASIDQSISETDKGIYDAMNKGLAMAKGEFACFINLGDKLLLSPVSELAAQPHDTAAVAFAVQLSTGKIRKPAFSSRLRWENTLPHQGLYYRVDACGRYDLAFRIFSDYDLNQRLWNQKKKIVLYPELINAVHGVDGVSQSKEAFAEIFAVIQKNFGAVQSWLAKWYFRIKYGLLGRS